MKKALFILVYSSLLADPQPVDSVLWQPVNTQENNFQNPDALDEQNNNDQRGFDTRKNYWNQSLYPRSLL
jgi:hypothetical protein